MQFRRLAAAFLIATASLAAAAQDRVVYHFDDSAAQGLKGLRNIRNHIDR